MKRIAIAAAALALFACGAPEERGASPPQPTPPPLTEPIPGGAPTDATDATLPAAASTEPPLDLAHTRPWLDDPRLGDARAKLDKDDAAGAAHAVDAFLKTPAAAELTAGGRAELAYLVGTLLARAGAPKPARDRFLSVATDDAAPHALAAYARLRAVEAEIAAGHHAAAVELAGSIDPSAISEAKLDAVLVVSLVRAGKLDLARTRADRLFAESSRPPDWPTRAIALGRAWLSAPGVDRAREAAKLAMLVRKSAPRGRFAKEADELLARAVGTLPSAERARLTVGGDERKLEDAEDLVESKQAKRALATLDRFAKKRGAAPAAGAQAPAPDDFACKLASVRGRALGDVKRLAEASDELALAVRVCPKNVDTLYAAARAAQRADRHADARALFAELEAAFPKETLADDARVEGAREALLAGDLTGFRTLLQKIADDYPNGDRSGDGVFLLATEAMERGAWEEASAALTRGGTLPREHVYYRAGRFTYFEGRARLALGDEASAKRRFIETIENAPLSYYAALAASRLDALDPGAGMNAVRRANEGSAAPIPEVAASRETTDPKIAALVVLARAGDSGDLEDALDALGVRTRTAPPDVLVLGARLYAANGDARRAHLLLRTASEIEGRPGRVECTALFEAAPVGAWRDLWRIAYPEPFVAEATKASSESGVPLPLLYAVMREESAFQPSARSVSNARGLVQVMPATGAKIARNLGIHFKTQTLFEPEANLRIGARFLAGLRNRFAFAPALAVPGYNAGPGAPEAWLKDRAGWDFDLWVERIPYTETRNYTKRVLASFFAYDVLYGDAGARSSIALPRTLPSL